MLNVILTIHLLACIAMVGVIMLQRSEGGVQGLSGGGTGGIISGRGAANVLVRTTMICALIFFCTSLLMTRLNADDSSRPNGYQQEINKANSGANVLGTETPAASPSAPAASPSAVPASPDPFAAVTSTPSGVMPSAAPLTPGAPASSAPSPAPRASAPPPAATNSPAATPAPSGSPQ